MAITISGANNVDKILATDGVLDSISGFNVVGVMTAGTFDVTGKTTTGHLNIGSNIQIGNAGIITATTLVGNVTGNINATSNLLLQIGGSEKFRVASSGQLGIGGANYGSSGQVLTSGGSGSAATWSTIASDKITEGNTEAEVVDTGSDGHFKVTTEGTERLRINSAGKLIISNHGTNDLRSLSVLAPATQIQFGTANDVGGFLLSTNAGQFGLSGGAYYNGGAWVATHTASAQMRTDGDGDISFCSNTSLTSGNTFTPSEIVTITSAGRVGIDRTSPNTMLDIKVPPLDTATITTTNCLQLGMLLTSGGTGSNTDGHIYNGLAVGDGYAGLYGKDGGSSAATDLEFFTGSASAVAGRVRIQDDGKIIIGGNVSQSINRNISIVAPTGNSQDIVIGLQPTNSSGGYNPEAYIGATADGNYGAAMYFYTRNTSGTRAEKLRITSDGDVAITTRGTVEGVSKLNVEIPSRTTAFSASDGDTWHDVLIENPGSATTNAIGLCFQVTGDSYHKNAGTGIAAVKNGTDSDYGADLVFITRPQNAVAAERLRISSDGYVTKPNHPSFCARWNSGNGFVNTDIICLTRMSGWHSWNSGHYSTSTGKFTAPVDGVYYFEAQAMTTGHSNGDNIQDMMTLESNRGRISYCRQRQTYFRTDENANGYFTNSVGGSIKLNATDTVWFQRKSGHSWGFSNQYYTYFTGWLIG